MFFPYLLFDLTRVIDKINKMYMQKRDEQHIFKEGRGKDTWFLESRRGMLGRSPKG